MKKTVKLRELPKNSLFKVPYSDDIFLVLEWVDDNLIHRSVEGELVGKKPMKANALNYEVTMICENVLVSKTYQKYRIFSKDFNEEIILTPVNNDDHKAAMQGKDFEFFKHHCPYNYILRRLLTIYKNYSDFVNNFDFAALDMTIGIENWHLSDWVALGDELDEILTAQAEADYFRAHPELNP